MEVGWPQAIVLLVALQRVAELVVSHRNTKRLKAAGALEHGAAHYPLFVLLHGGWLASLFFLVPATAPIHLGWLGLFVLLQGARVWVLLSLGPNWSTRVLSMPGRKLVARGPYRWLRHPNYLIVVLEIAALPLVFGSAALALIFTLLNAGLIAHRIHVEDKALAASRGSSGG
ncbi:MAG: isoprenylcysteine carboxylmethyltransferase family protein [Rhodovibrionaceae bacterium]|nr:isoprenylcysteine carboxylmethyltransferase family protein [Rhodovibrionaceae bacterium]